jgi:transmembrane 9 superfamily protein 2/4
LILARALNKDIAVYNEGDIHEDPEEVSGWKMVHGDVFRPPRRAPMVNSDLHAYPMISM